MSRRESSINVRRCPAEIRVASASPCSLRIIVGAASPSSVDSSGAGSSATGSMKYVIVKSPMPMTLPGESRCSATALPPMVVPFVLPRSRIHHRP